MHCPHCHSSNPRNAIRCQACSAELPGALPAPAEPHRPARASRPGRRRAQLENIDRALGDQAEGNNRSALYAYRLSLFGLVPFVGLLLGPLAALLAGRARRRGRSDPEFVGDDVARAAFFVGTATGLTQWLGLALMLWGWSHP
jgi:hypothetical protein